MRMFVDTSVIGGCFDEEFDVVSRLLLAEFKSGNAVAVISSMTLNRIRLFAATNLKHGLLTPEIRSPREVLTDYEEDL